MIRIYEYAGSGITFDSDGDTFVNATEMAKPFGKRVNDFMNLKSTQAYLEALETTINNGSLIKTVEGRNGGTWMHELLALEFAGWLAPAFKVWCNQKIKEMLTSGSSMTMEDMMIHQLEAMKEHKRKLAAVEDRVLRIESRTVPSPDYFTIAGFATYNGLNVNLKVASSLGRKASHKCKQLGLMMDEIPDPRFGRVRMYPKHILEEVFAEPMM